MKLYIETMGCPKNFNDSEGAAGIWENSGMTITDNPYDADAIMVNTCGFINDAKQESIDMIFDMARLIDEDESVNRKVLIVSGCLTQRFGDELYEEIPEIDIVLGVNEYEKLPEIVRNFKAGQRQKHIGCNADTFAEFTARKYEDNPYTATVRIAEGCNNCCTYCVIPMIRGGYRSRPWEAVVDEVKEMAARGTKEIILIAQDVTEYGTDLYGRPSLPMLLRYLCKIEGIRWIRLMYCYEDKITDELIQIMAEEPKICHYIDIPLQHASDRVLRDMNRHSSRASIDETIRKLRTAMPDITIRTTLIVGFPGETEEDFAELQQFVAQQRFERLGAFTYSREEGTPAAERTDQIPEAVKEERLDALMVEQMQISLEHNQALIGKKLEVMVDRLDEDGESYVGRTRMDAPEIDNSVIFSAVRDHEPGDIVTVEILDAFDYDLEGREV